MDKDFKQAVDKVLKLEGGYIDHPDDRGGPTNYGITQKVARKNGYKGDMKELPKEEAEEIYYREYWKANKYEQIDDDKLAARLFDIAVNMGSRTANRFVQQACNLLPSDGEISEDGIIGPQTLGAVNNHRHPDRLLKVVIMLQGERYLNIVRNNSSQQVFLGGWANRLFEGLCNG
ncbi:secretion activating protein [Natroniella acetigena]|uniref:glycoside hydrolase family 108 protein n=1 Tax=Natroniella acetigena TaxID=52004 RepID=UPI00200B4C9E|nr:glycosyl hydrolase 108 family protein [Natroniella acetigena]MCK8826420.1 secretion activating protein [Natroniella acetigena]